MNKVQFVKFLQLRGIKKLKSGQSIADSMKESGGDSTEKEMIIVNEMAMNYYILKCVKLEKANKSLKVQLAAMEGDVEWLGYLERAGVDTWDGYDVAQEKRDEDNEPKK